jgi:hypothetical protein
MLEQQLERLMSRRSARIAAEGGARPRADA